MIVYIESNFLQEIALQQREFSFAASILKLAEQGKIQLIFPDIALCEPFTTVMYRNRDRKRILNDLSAALQQLRRSKYHEQIMKRASPVISVLTQAESLEMAGLDEVMSRLLSVGLQIHIDNKCFKQAILYRENYNLSAQDSLVYAGLIADLQARPLEEKKSFLSLDRKAFADVSGMKAELAPYNCRYIGSFQQGLDYIEHTLQSAG